MHIFFLMLQEDSYWSGLSVDPKKNEIRYVGMWQCPPGIALLDLPTIYLRFPLGLDTVEPVKDGCEQLRRRGFFSGQAYEPLYGSPGLRLLAPSSEPPKLVLDD